jgi:hypothetical protein
MVGLKYSNKEHSSRNSVYDLPAAPEACGNVV